MRRQDAEKQLRWLGSSTGTFLIRESDAQPGCFALSLHDGTSVKHYRIRRADSGGFFIGPNKIFRNLDALIRHYQSSADGLVVQLGQPCSKEELHSALLPCNELTKMDTWEIDKGTVELQTVLGAGQFGEVWYGVWNGTIPVAVKTLKPGTMDPTDFLAEAQIMKKLRYAKLVQLYAVCTQEEPIYIVTELMTHGSLLKYLRAEEGKKLHLAQLIDIAAQIADGMAYLEAHNFIHRDLAARNILVGDGLMVKVADFGLSRFICSSNYHAREGTKLPVRWTAPEAIFYNCYSVKSDVWSFGVVLMELVTYGQCPYHGMSKAEVLARIEGGYRMPKPDSCPEALYHTTLTCWRQEPQERPTFEYLKYLLDDYFISAEEGTYVGAM